MFRGRQAEEPRAEKRSKAEIEGLLRLLLHQLRGKIRRAGLAKSARVKNRQIEQQSRSDQLAELASFIFKSRPERFVTGHDFIQRTPEHELIERPLPTHRERHVERRVAGLQLIKEPKASLRRSRRKNEEPLVLF